MEERVEKQSEQSLLRKKKKRKEKKNNINNNNNKSLARVYMWKRVDPFVARAKSARASSDWLNECSRMLSLTRLDRVDPAGGAKVFIQRNVPRLGGVTLPSQKGHRSRRATFLYLI